MTVSPGTKITFDNKGRNPHNVIPVDEDQFEAIPTDEFQPGDTARGHLRRAGLLPVLLLPARHTVGGHGRSDPVAEG